MDDDRYPDLQPTLTGDTILIRPLRADDWTDLFRAAADPLIWELHPARERHREPAFRGYFDGAMASKGAFAFIERATGEIVGSSRYYQYNPARSEIEIGWTFLVRKCWGGNTNREIKTLMLDHAFTFVDTVVFWVGQENWRSQRAMEKIGGIRRDGLFSRPSVPGAHVVFEIHKSRR
ncbi:MAG TPA: GNAT family N-acetyltransferase [Steroidobacteraceae bacterium]|jgi:RimJ/RimL family protein N-acetyltransferase|nr:GNAT family N-acetyltransferase [Steroidobacteraceae bacterium]